MKYLLILLFLITSNLYSACNHTYITHYGKKEVFNLTNTFVLKVETPHTFNYSCGEDIYIEPVDQTYLEGEEIIKIFNYQLVNIYWNVYYTNGKFSHTESTAGIFIHKCKPWNHGQFLFLDADREEVNYYLNKKFGFEYENLEFYLKEFKKQMPAIISEITSWKKVEEYYKEEL